MQKNYEENKQKKRENKRTAYHKLFQGSLGQIIFDIQTIQNGERKQNKSEKRKPNKEERTESKFKKYV